MGWPPSHPVCTAVKTSRAVAWNLHFHALVFSGQPWCFCGTEVLRLRADSPCLHTLAKRKSGHLLAYVLRAVEILVRVDLLAGARPPSRLTFQQASKHRWVPFLASLGGQSISFQSATAQSWFRSAYPLNVAAFSSLLSFFQRSHLSGKRLKVFLSAHLWCGTVWTQRNPAPRPQREAVS